MQEIIIVSGLPRSGTSMVMQLLEAGGLEILTDNIRAANEDNQQGYYELEIVKKLSEDDSFLKDAPGKVVKVISELLEYLPSDYAYKVVFVRRDMSEILASQKKMLARRGKPLDGISDQELSQLFEMSIDQARNWMNSQPNVDFLEINYNELMTNARQTVESLADFLGRNLQKEKMIAVPQQRFYRNRG